MKQRSRRNKCEYFIKNVSEMLAVFKLYGNRCVATGEVFKPEELTLIQVKPDLPLSIENAVPVSRKFSRFNAHLPEVLVKNVERFKV